MKTWVDPQKHGVKMKTFLTTRQQQKHTRTCHPHVMGLIWWHFLTALMVNHDMDSFLSVTPATEVEAPVQSTCFCVSFRMFIFEKKTFFSGTPCPSPFTYPFIWKHQFDLKTPFYLKMVYTWSIWEWWDLEFIYYLHTCVVPHISTRKSSCSH